MQAPQAQITIDKFKTTLKELYAEAAEMTIAMFKTLDPLPKVASSMAHAFRPVTTRGLSRSFNLNLKSAFPNRSSSSASISTHFWHTPRTKASGASARSFSATASHQQPSLEPPAEDNGEQYAAYLGTTKRLPEFSLANKVIVVTGGARGIGLIQAEALLEAGATGKYSLKTTLLTNSNIVNSIRTR